MNRKICVVTGTRADYGLLRWVMQGIKDDSELTLQVIATGMHLSQTFGLTYREIERDGFDIDVKIETIGDSDTPMGISESIAQGIRGCATAINELQPDLIVLLGDRFEIFAAAAAAMAARVPIAHIHGGEATEGLIDEAIRHSITKMSHIHFVAAAEYRDRVIQLGESPDKVFLVGGLGLDNISRLDLLDKEALQIALGIKFERRSLLITFHPVTLEIASAENQLKELLAALSNLEETTLIFTLPNADTGGRVLINIIEDFVQSHPRAYSYKSLGQLKYLSCVKHVDGVIGNSSSGLIEVPSLKKGTINIGDRQRGRLKSQSVIDCLPTRISIEEGLRQLYSPEFQDQLKTTENLYGTSGASEKILSVIKDIELSSLLKKQFYTLEYDQK
jgi:GDP/UDP-N,N'-diacetylbacillosamine 2-epimerase (hydrolysing)